MKTIQIQLKCNTENALQMLREQTDTPSGFRLFRIMKNPWFWGKIEQNRIKIWPKGPNKDISSAYITGQINDTGSLFLGKIVNDPVIRIPSWLLAIAAIIGFPSFGYTMYSFFSLGDYYIPAFLTMIVSIGIILIGTLQRTSEGQEEELETPDIPAVTPVAPAAGLRDAEKRINMHVASAGIKHQRNESAADPHRLTQARKIQLL